MKISLPFIGGICMSCLIVLTYSQDLIATWTLRATEMKEMVKAEAIICFLDETAKFCLPPKAIAAAIWPGGRD